MRPDLGCGSNAHLFNRVQRRGGGGVMLTDRMRNRPRTSRNPAETRGLVLDTDIDDELRWSIEAAANSDLTVLLSGDCGGGQSLIAQLIHQSGPRAQAPLATINPARMSSVAFATDLALLAPGGTLVIDDVARLTPRLQVVLFRHLDCALRSAAMSCQLPAARVIVATRQSLYAEVLAGRFRHDLFYRLNIIQLQIMPLRIRPEEAMVLA